MQSMILYVLQLGTQVKSADIQIAEAGLSQTSQVELAITCRDHVTFSLSLIVHYYNSIKTARGYQVNYTILQIVTQTFT